MTFENKPCSLLSPDAGQATDSLDSHVQKHVLAQEDVQALKLVDVIASPELAKYSVGAIEQSQSPPAEDVSPTDSPTIVKRSDSFLKALEDFETSLETPVMSGELIDWVTNVRRECEHIGQLLRDDVQRQHAALYATIAREDPELSSRVEKLRETDGQLAFVDFGSVQGILKQLLDRAESVEQDELKASQLRAEVVKQALAFVIGARTQETAIAAWLGEAFNRDSGFGD